MNRPNNSNNPIRNYPVRRFLANKKGFTYILVTSFLVVVLLLVFFTTSNYKYQDQEALQQIRIRAMNDFMKNLEDDIHRATYISAFRTLLALEDHVSTNASKEFREAFFYGTINGTTEGTILNESTFEVYLSRVQNISKSTGINLDINVTDVRLTQSNPWSIDVHLMMNITAVDVKNTSSWHINKEYVTSLPIDTLKDPLYFRIIGNASPNIRKLDVLFLVNGTNVTNLKTHIEGVYYINSPYAPSYIMRMEGNNSPDPNGNGIESIVNFQDLENLLPTNPDLLIDPNKVKIDYIYFDTTVNPNNKSCNFTGIPTTDYFVIPSDRIMMYQLGNVSHLNTTCPN
jgi:hypothetical protein